MRGYEGPHARRCTLTLTHGIVQTPVFMPVGAYGTLKGMMPRSLHEMGRKISEEDVCFASPANGDKLFLKPEVSMQIQTVLNSNIGMPFDECTPYDVKACSPKNAQPRLRLRQTLSGIPKDQSTPAA